MSKIRDMLRPLFRVAVGFHIRKLCNQTKKEFDSYKNKHTGDRCFIVANGPSLKMEDLNLLWKNNEITFGMNRIYVLYDRTIWRPTYYVIQDPTVIRSCYDELLPLEKEVTMFVKVPGERKFVFRDAININMDYSKSERNRFPDFSKGVDCTFADGRTVTYTALQLAVYMGFKEIYLLGADCNYSNDNKSINEDSYPDKRMYNPKKVGLNPMIEYNLSAYEVARKYAKIHGVKIFNATRGGKLEVFERVDFDQLFENVRL